MVKKAKFQLYLSFMALGVLCFGCQLASTSIKYVKGLFLTPPEVSTFPPMSSQFKIERKDLIDWDNIASGLLKGRNLKRFGDASRLFAYLYSAQKAFADASFQISTSFSGSLDPISLHVIQLFYPDYVREEMKTDEYSEKLTELVVKKIDVRFRQEEANIRPLKIEKSEKYWSVENPRGTAVPTMRPWALKKADEFRSATPPPPGHDFWKEQTQAVHSELDNLTDWKRSRSMVWQGIGGTDAGDWRILALSYIEKRQIPLELELEVREKIALAILDALISAYDSKYAYLVQRPSVRDLKIKTSFPTPGHPSYPSGQAAVSTAVGVVLSYYFPENQNEWSRLVNEAGKSRIWAGVHFPIDQEAGKRQGRLVGKAVIFR